MGWLFFGYSNCEICHKFLTLLGKGFILEAFREAKSGAQPVEAFTSLCWVAGKVIDY